MTRTATISKQQLLDAAFSIATEEGLAHLNIRKIAERCNVSVGSLYNYFPTKGDLIADVVARFWRQAVPADIMRTHPGESFIDFYERISEDMRAVFAEFQENWLAQLATIDKSNLKAGMELEQEYFEHIQRGMLAVLEADEGIDKSAFDDEFTPEQVCAFAWGSLIMSLRKPDMTHTLAVILRRVLYK